MPCIACPSNRALDLSAQEANLRRAQAGEGSAALILFARSLFLAGTSVFRGALLAVLGTLEGMIHSRLRAENSQGEGRKAAPP